MKSFFLIPAVAISAALALAAIAGAVTSRYEQAAWWAAAAANLPLPLLYARLRFARPVRTSADLPLSILVSAAGAIVAAWPVVMSGSGEWRPVAIAVAGLGLLLLYVFWYSRFGRMPNPRLEIRNKLPEFELEDLDGKTVSSSGFLGSPTVWLFYRGNWDPFCVAQVHEVASRHADLEKLGAQLNLVSAQPAEKVRELAAAIGVPLRFLVDRDGKVAQSLDIAERHPLPPGAKASFAPVGPLPTVIVTNASGTILFTDQTDNYRVRPEPDIYISLLRRAGAVAQ